MSMFFYFILIETITIFHLLFCIARAPEIELPPEIRDLFFTSDGERQPTTTEASPFLTGPEVPRPLVSTQPSEPFASIPEKAHIDSTPDGGPMLSTPEVGQLLSMLEAKPWESTADVEPLFLAPEARHHMTTPEAEPIVSIPEAMHQDSVTLHPTEVGRRFSSVSEAAAETSLLGPGSLRSIPDAMPQHHTPEEGPLVEYFPESGSLLSTQEGAPLISASDIRPLLSTKSLSDAGSPISVPEVGDPEVGQNGSSPVVASFTIMDRMMRTLKKKTSSLDTFSRMTPLLSKLMLGNIPHGE